MTKRKRAVPCPCQSGQPRSRCCGPYVDGKADAPTALACMRSRYTAYDEGASSYLLATWHPATRPQEVQQPDGVRWLGLAIKRTEAGTEDDAEGIVEFTARLRVNGRGERLHECSRFVREAGLWRYLGPLSTPDASV